MINKVLSTYRAARDARHVRMLLEEHAVRRREAPLEIERLFPAGGTERRMLLLVEREELHGRAFFLRSLGAPIVRGLPDRPRADDVAICFGHTSLERHAAALRRSGLEHLLLFEAGFLRSVVLDNSSSVFDQSLCFFVDDLGFHFDPRTPTRLERVLNDPHLNPTPADLSRARALRDCLVRTQLTKYNDQTVSVPLGPKRSPRVLVVEQARDDWAVVASGGGRRSFDSMLRAAIDENPGAEILVKVHPDTLDGKRGGLRRSYFGRLQDDARITIIREKVNPFALLETVDRVYVFSSMLGFEALLMGKEVHVFGGPCYAGWGLTHDRRSFPRRTRRRTLDELVYAVYFAYQKYKNLAGEWCSPEEAVGILLDLRERYRSAA